MTLKSTAKIIGLSAAALFLLACDESKLPNTMAESAKVKKQVHDSFTISLQEGKLELNWSAENIHTNEEAKNEYIAANEGSPFSMPERYESEIRNTCSWALISDIQEAVSAKVKSNLCFGRNDKGEFLRLHEKLKLNSFNSINSKCPPNDIYDITEALDATLPNWRHLIEPTTSAQIITDYKITNHRLFIFQSRFMKNRLIIYSRTQAEESGETRWCGYTETNIQFCIISVNQLLNARSLSTVLRKLEDKITIFNLEEE